MQRLPAVLLEQAIRQARAAGQERVSEVRAAIGELIPVDEESFRADWVMLAARTPIAAATLHIRRVPAEFQCMACFTKYQPAGPEPACPNCGSVGAKILAGEEFILEEIR